MKKNRKLAKEWFFHGDEDEKAIQAILENNGPFSTVCFLCQQMAEKYLKGFLVFHNKKFPKSHDLIDLLRRCIEIDTSVKRFQNKFLVLNRYYVATRYPGDWLERYSKRQAKEAFGIAKELKQFILKKL